MLATKQIRKQNRQVRQWEKQERTYAFTKKKKKSKVYCELSSTAEDFMGTSI